MMKVSLIRNQSGEFHGWMLYCPGCEDYHVFDSRWDFNGDLERPTFSPSLLVKSVSGEKEVCHSFMREGNWGYLSDSSHGLAGQTIPAPDQKE